jgi:hypothetical protein
MVTEVDLGAFILPDDHRIFKFFPGRSYKFEDVVGRTGVAYLDVRGLDDFGPLASWDEEAILTHIAQDRVRRMVEEGGRQPSRIVRSPRDKANLTFLNGLLKDAQKGDLILMPTAGRDVKVGMFASRAGSTTKVTSRGRGSTEIYLGRKVTWLKTVSQDALPAPLFRLLVSPAAFFPLNEAFYPLLYRLIFDSFVHDGVYVSTFRTSKDIFTSKDNLLTSLWFELIEVLGQASEQGASLSGSIYDLAVQSDIEEAERNDLSILVQSPGWFRLRALTVEPLVAIALFTLATAGTPYDEAVAAQTTATTVRPTSTGCLSAVDESVRQYIELLGKDRWDASCELAVKANERATLDTNASLKHRKKSAKGRP